MNIGGSCGPIMTEVTEAINNIWVNYVNVTPKKHFKQRRRIIYAQFEDCSKDKENGKFY